jgi:hypothetical protein
MRFAGLGCTRRCRTPRRSGSNREQLKQAGAIDGLLRRFDEVLASKGFLAMGGRHLDRRTALEAHHRGEGHHPGGGTPADWSAAQRAQKDRDGRWTLRRGRTKPKSEGHQRQAIQIAVRVFGYKSHIGIDRRHEDTSNYRQLAVWRAGPSPQAMTCLC